MTLFNNYNTNDGMADNNNGNDNNSGRNSIEFTAATNSVRPSCSNINVMVESGLKWKTNVVPGCTTSSTVTLPRRDFHFKRIEVEEAPKWFVWPKRNKESSKSSRNEKNMSHEKSSSSSGNNSISRPDILLPQRITNLTNANNNRQHNLNYMALAQSENDNTVMVQSGARQHHELHYRNVIGTELINTPNSQPSSHIMRCHIATTVDSEQCIAGSAPTISQTFKILSISKKPLENCDDDDLDLTNSVISNCRQSHSQPTVLLSQSATAGDTVKEVH
ncbi:unnamed protein product [Cercopithifilaria johnstoni]|uniref:Uncharacterized protein n=1 Tax=Cercopithifilaria johnstoni TaxID=2874296 RepID=A0A8J2MDF1_9BILA|nr:unnamed protein product [Cercopithifilaria johnstoni]